MELRFSYNTDDGPERIYFEGFTSNGYVGSNYYLMEFVNIICKNGEQDVLRNKLINEDIFPNSRIPFVIETKNLNSKEDIIKKYFTNENKDMIKMCLNVLKKLKCKETKTK